MALVLGELGRIQIFQQYIEHNNLCLCHDFLSQILVSNNKFKKPILMLISTLHLSSLWKWLKPFSESISACNQCKYFDCYDIIHSG